MRFAIGDPSTRIAPAETSRSRIAVRKRVVLPDPLGPRIATRSSGPRAASTPCRISWPPMAARTSRNSRPAGPRRRPGGSVARARPGGSRSGLPAATRRRDDVVGQLHGLRIGELEEAVDVPDVAGRPLLQVQDPVGAQVQGLLDPVLDDDDRAALVGQVAEQGQQPLGGRRVEVGQGLVDDEDPRPEHEDAGHREELALAAGQGRRLATEQVLDPGAGRHVADPLADLLARHAPVLGAEGELGLDHRADDLLGRILEDGADRGPDVAELQLGGRPARRPGPTPLELARVGVRDEAVDGPDERALAAARRTGDEDDLAGIDGQRDVADRRLGRPAVAVGQARRPRTMGSA